MLEDRQEIVVFSSHVPVKLFIHKLGDVSPHWHRSLELLLVLDGEIDIAVASQVWHMQAEEMILINPSTMHSLKSAGAVMLAVQINPEKINLADPEAGSPYFECNSRLVDNPAGYAALKTIIARLIKHGAAGGRSDSYHDMALACSLYAALLDHFSVNPERVQAASGRQVERINRVIAYINAHYREGLTLQQVAGTEGLSGPYFSMFFESETGINFSTYYSNVRLEHAASDLLETTDNIESIALRNGYAEPHAFMRAFKKHFGMPPGTYRRNYADLAQTGRSGQGINYLTIEPGNYLQSLTKYLVSTADEAAVAPAASRRIVGQTIDTSSAGKPFGRAFGKFVGVGSALELLFKEVQDMLTDLQKSVGFEFVKFHGLLSDELLVCCRRDGELRFNFCMVDKVLDFLLSISLKPLIQLSFMPACLAENTGKRTLADRFITSAPQDIAEWNSLIRALAVHLIERYGRAAVRSWLFSVWNEPDLSETMFSIGDEKKFYELYAGSWRTLKSVDEHLVVGAPSNMPISADPRAWMTRFLRACAADGCRPQFLNIHYYSDNYDRDEVNIYDTPGLRRTSILHRDPNHFQTFLDSLDEIRNQTGTSDLPVYLTEWNLAVSHRNLINDTCFIAAWLVRNMMDNESRLDSFGYWSLTDFINEQQHAEPLFHGGLGLYTRNGIRKPAFFAFQFARRLAGDCLARGENYVVTRNDGVVRILSWNYVHFSDLFAKGEIFDMTATNRYTPFSHQQSIQINLLLQNIAGEQLTIREHYINRQQGSAFDQWVAMGAQAMETAEEAQMLKQAVRPGFHKAIAPLENGGFEYQAVLEPHEIRLAEISVCES